MRASGRLQPPLTRPLETASPFAAIPSWLASVVVHLLFFLLVAAGLRGCGGDPLGVPTEELRDVGIFIAEEATVIDAPEAPQNDDFEDKTNTTEAELQPQEIVESNPPTEISLPSEPLATIGAGTPPGMPATLANDVRELVNPNGVRPPSSLGLGKGETSFLDIRDSGNSFVYLIDSSGSMYGRPMQYARSQLKASLRRLERTQQFQVIFYAEKPYPLSIKRSPGKAMYWATDLNVNSACLEIDKARPDAGTEHVPALEDALGLHPEVIFLLTDADEPLMSAGEIDAVTRLNDGRTRIHCIEFGSGPELSAASWLKKLARRNGGSYRYRDVRRLPKQ